MNNKTIKKTAKKTVKAPSAARDKSGSSDAVFFTKDGLLSYVTAITYTTEMQTALYIYRSLETAVEDNPKVHASLEKLASEIEAELSAFSSGIPEDGSDKK